MPGLVGASGSRRRRLHSAPTFRCRFGWRWWHGPPSGRQIPLRGHARRLLACRRDGSSRGAARTRAAGRTGRTAPSPRLQALRRTRVALHRRMARGVDRACGVAVRRLQERAPGSLDRLDCRKFPLRSTADVTGLVSPAESFASCPLDGRFLACEARLQFSPVFGLAEFPSGKPVGQHREAVRDEQAVLVIRPGRLGWHLRQVPGGGRIHEPRGGSRRGGESAVQDTLSRDG